MKLVYVAGPYSGKDRKAVSKNIAIARRYAIALTELNIGFICPHLMTAHFGDDSSALELYYYELGFELLSRCDIVLILPNWQNSKGTKLEIKLAQERGIPIFYAKSIKDLGGLLEYFAKR